MNPYRATLIGPMHWTYSVDALGGAYQYLVLTEDTNKTTTPIKFALPPFVPGAAGTNVTLSDFETAAVTNYTNGTTINDETAWSVLNNQVSVVNDPTTADAGNNFLALANGTISNTLPTVAGQAYVLTFRYRGPGIAGWWRGESNALDSSGNNNNGVLTGGVTYTNGEVDQAFQLNGTSAYVLVPDPADRLNFDARSNNYTVAFWVNLADVGSRQDFIIDRAYNNVPCSYDIYYDPGSGNRFIANCWDGAVNVSVPSITTPAANTWYHVAATYNSPVIKLYVNGIPEVGTPLPGTSETIPANYGSTLNTDAARLIGRANIFGTQPNYTHGELDEVQVFNRALSDSEIKAIDTLGTNGTFDPTEFASSPPLSLAEAQVSINGGTPTTFFGSNTKWQTKTIVFTATQNGTPLQLTGVEPGMLVDSFTLSQPGGDLYYLPEEALDAYDGLNASGLWTLEIQDDRVGATNPAPSLVSWQLRFNYVTTGTSPNAIPSGPRRPT